MLILERKNGQKVILKTSEGTIEIMIYDANKGHVKLGINAPKSINIAREELLDSKKLR